MHARSIRTLLHSQRQDAPSPRTSKSNLTDRTLDIHAPPPTKGPMARRFTTEDASKATRRAMVQNPGRMSLGLGPTVQVESARCLINPS